MSEKAAKAERRDAQEEIVINFRAVLNKGGGLLCTGFPLDFDEAFRFLAAVQHSVFRKIMADQAEKQKQEREPLILAPSAGLYIPGKQ